MNENLKNQRNQLIKNEKLAAIGELSSRIAHDLRNPLHVLQFSMELLTLKNKDYANSKEKPMIDRAIKRLTHQIDDVLEFIKPSELKLTNTSIQKCLTNSISGLIVPDNIKIIISEKDYTITSDYKKLEIVFTNLIRNSVQAIEGQKGEIKITIRDMDKNIILTFGDTGKNIPESDLSKIFEPLFTTKQEGTGLGLVSCKKIIEQLKGTITVENNPKLFTIILPKNLPV